VTLEVVAILLTLLVHILGAMVLVGVLLNGEKIDWRGLLFPNDDDGPGPSFDDPIEPDPVPSGGGMPLPDASPSPVRLREPGRIGETYPRPSRRPAHAPQRTPAREPAES
jgi:hypothetical protein